MSLSRRAFDWQSESNLPGFVVQCRSKGNISGGASKC